MLTPGYPGKTNDKGKPATGKSGSALAFMGLMHSFCVGDTLRETLWLNLFTANDIAALTQYPSGLGRAPWEEMPEGEDCPVARELKRNLMGRLVPLGRFCLLAEGGLHYSEGISHGNYKEGFYDPSVLINKKGKELKVKWTDPVAAYGGSSPHNWRFYNRRSLNGNASSCALLLKRSAEQKSRSAFGPAA